KIFLVGLGATLLSKEKASHFLGDLSKTGNAAANETKEFIDKLSEKGQAKKDQWNDDMKQSIKDAVEELGFVTKDDYLELKTQIETLEKKISQLTKDDHTSES
ncbi:MAG: hypothetical protein ABF586_12720, partial [Sporolactobacillus sp.]